MSLTKKTLTGTIWAFSTSYLNIFISFWGNLIMARILIPDDFGIFALSTSLLMFVTMFTGFGSQEAIIQCHDEVIKELIPTAFWLSIAVGVIVSLAGVLTGMAANLYYGSTVGLLIVSLSVLIPLSSLGNAHVALLRRNLIIKPVVLLRTGSVLISFILGIIASLMRLGPWALFIRQSSELIIFSFGIQIVSKYRLKFVFNKAAARWIWSFGWRQMVSQITDVIFGRYDNLMIGTFIGSVQLGNYNQAYRLAWLGQQFTQGAISPVLTPMFATVQFSPEKLRYSFERVNYWVYRTIPLLGVLILLLGERAVIFLYGQKWAIAGHYFEDLFVFFIFLPISTVLLSFLVGSGYINDVVKIKIFQAAIFTVSITLGAFLKDINVVIWIVNLNQVLVSFLMGYKANQIIAIKWGSLTITPIISFLITVLVGQRIAFLFLNSLPNFLVLVLLLVIIYSAIIVALEYRLVRQELRIIWRAGRG